jgi:cobalt-zinc-cadmium resistance protein CzcA
VLKQAIFEGALSRLRPVLMTAVTSALGLIPLLMATGIGSEVGCRTEPILYKF